MAQINASRLYYGSQVAEDLGGGEVGLNMFTSEAGISAPQYHTLYLWITGLINPATSFAFNIAPYTGVYAGDGGGVGADYLKCLSHGDLGYGLQVDMKWNDSAFNPVNVYTVQTGVMDAYETRQVIKGDAMVYFDGQEKDAIAPANGTIATQPNSNYGDAAHLRYRWAVPPNELVGGNCQVDFVFSFNYTT